MVVDRDSLYSDTEPSHDILWEYSQFHQDNDPKITAAIATTQTLLFWTIQSQIKTDQPISAIETLPFSDPSPCKAAIPRCRTMTPLAFLARVVRWAS